VPILLQKSKFGSAENRRDPLKSGLEAKQFGGRSRAGAAVGRAKRTSGLIKPPVGDRPPVAPPPSVPSPTKPTFNRDHEPEGGGSSS
jgi:hypothetical protein